jgi:hypothetical protein
MSKATGADRANNQVIQREMNEQPAIWITEWHESRVSHGYCDRFCG